MKKPRVGGDSRTTLASITGLGTGRNTLRRCGPLVTTQCFNAGTISAAVVDAVLMHDELTFSYAFDLRSLVLCQRFVFRLKPEAPAKKSACDSSLALQASMATTRNSNADEALASQDSFLFPPC